MNPNLTQIKNKSLEEAIAHWDYVAPILKPPRNNKEYNDLISYLDKLLEIVGGDESHHLLGLVDAISTLIAAYEEAHLQRPKIKGVAALKYLMEAHHLKQSDLLEVGSQGVISDILNGKRILNLRQIKLLAERFHVEPATFIDD